jgi:hypothetical protein
LPSCAGAMAQSQNSERAQRMPKVSLFSVIVLLNLAVRGDIIVGPSKLYFEFLHLSCQPFVQRAMQSDEDGLGPVLSECKNPRRFPAGGW